MPRRVIARERDGVTMFYGDFRDYAAQGGKYEALKIAGEHRATRDEKIATKLAADRLKELEEKKRDKVLFGIERRAGLDWYCVQHLEKKKKAGKVTRGWLGDSGMQLQRAVDFFGPDRDLRSITPQDGSEWASWLGTIQHGRGGTLGGGTIRHHLNTLSNLYRRAVSEGYATINPIQAMLEKPTASREEAKWLEVPDAALFLEAARLHSPDLVQRAFPHPYPLIATFLLTGGRMQEVLGLDVEDISFDRGTVTFRPNAHRRLKTSTSHRSVPMWPQLREALQEYVFGAGKVSGLLFPSPMGTGMLQDLRKLLNAIGERASFAKGEITSKMFRHTYCAARLQTLDRGAPVSPWTVAKEMGHGGRSLIDRVYGHLGDVRHRSKVVEYRVEQHKGALGERLTALL